MPQPTSGPARPARVALVAVVAAALAAGGCSRATSGQGQAEQPLTVGISLSGSGDFADPSRAARRGYELWAETTNAKGGILGRKVQLTILDDASDPDRAAANYEKLITEDKVDLVLG